MPRNHNEAEGHDVVRVAQWGSDPGDFEVLARAHAEGRVLVTSDKEFGELAIVQGKEHSEIVRVVGLAVRQQGVAVVEVLHEYEQELLRGAILTVHSDRVRVRST